MHVAAPGSTIYSTVPYSFTNLYSDDFSTVSAWNAPTPWGRNTTVFSSSPSSACYHPGDTYQNDGSSLFTMKDPVNCQSLKNILVELRMRMNTRENEDYLNLIYSFDGKKWETLDFFTGSTNGRFKLEQSKLLPLAGTKKQVYFGFNFTSDFPGQKDGVFIDDLVVYTRNYGSHGYDYYSGTSMATPMVAGVAALVRSVRPDFSPVQVKYAIMNNIDKKAALEGKVLTGGRVNAYNTLKAIKPVTPAPTASFTVSPDPAVVGQAVSFTDTSSGSPDQWQWDFGDESPVDTRQNPKHTYSAAGTYTTRLKVANAAGRSGWATKPLEVKEEAEESAVLSMRPGNLTLPRGKEGTVDLVLDRVPDGLENYTIVLSLGSPEVGELTGVSFPEWAEMEQNTTIPADLVRIGALDTGRRVNPGDRDIVLATISLRGDCAGTTIIPLDVKRISDDEGGFFLPVTRNGSLRVTSAVIAFPGQVSAPRDLDGDGLYEDINGNGRIDFQDVVLYFTNMEWIVENEPVASFDYNRNGRIDFQDVVLLFDMVGSSAGEDRKSAERTLLSATPAGNLVMSIRDAETAEGGTSSLPITLDAAPAGIAGGTVRVRVEDTSVAEITAVQPPPWAGVSDVRPGEAGAFQLAVADTTGSVQAGATGVLFGTVTVRAEGPGKTRVLLEWTSLDDDDGNPFPVATDAGTVTIRGSDESLRAGFTSDTTTGPAPLTVRFTDTSTGSPVKWFWTFGDGGTSQQQDPEYVYRQPGTYPVSLKVSNGRESYRRSVAGFIVVKGDE